MAKIRFFADEDVHGAAVDALRRAGFDAISTAQANRRGQSDEAQLQWTSDAGRVLVTFNVAHFAQLHADWLQRGRHHAGIVVSSQRPLRDFLRRLLQLAGQLDAETMRDRLEFLGDW